MKIIAGTARGVELTIPEGMDIRPTSVRARKALFDSLGDMSDMSVLDLCAGSGAIGFEAASRGASQVTMVEISQVHIGYISENQRKIAATGVDSAIMILNFDVLDAEKYLPRMPAKPDLIFADPPYGKSAEIFCALANNEYFCRTLSGSRIIWEIPDTPGAAGNFLNIPSFGKYSLRKLGGTLFFSGVFK